MSTDDVLAAVEDRLVYDPNDVDLTIPESETYSAQLLARGQLNLVQGSCETNASTTTDEMSLSLNEVKARCTSASFVDHTDGATVHFSKTGGWMREYSMNSTVIASSCPRCSCPSCGMSFMPQYRYYYRNSSDIYTVFHVPDSQDVFSIDQQLRVTLLGRHGKLSVLVATRALLDRIIGR